MRQLMKNLFFHDTNELEMTITISAARWAWRYSLVFLGILGILEMILCENKVFGIITLFLLISQNLIFMFLQLHYKKQMGFDFNSTIDEED